MLGTRLLATALFCQALWLLPCLLRPVKLPLSLSLRLSLSLCLAASLPLSLCRPVSASVFLVHCVVQIVDCIIVCAWSRCPKLRGPGKSLAQLRT